MEKWPKGHGRVVHYEPYIVRRPQVAPESRPGWRDAHRRAPASPNNSHAPTHAFPIQIAGHVREDGDELRGTDYWVGREQVTRVPGEHRAPAPWVQPLDSDPQAEAIASGAARLNLPTRQRQREVEIEREAIVREHKKPRGRRAPDFGSDAERSEYWVESELDALVPLLPYEIVLSMMGGARGWRQVPSAEARNKAVRRLLKQRAGSDGDRLASVRLMLRDVRLYAVTQMGVTRQKADEASFPMSSAMAHEIVATAHTEAIQRGNGSQGGATVGHHIREILIFAAEKLLWPIEVPRAVLDSAAPKAHTAPRTRAGTFPIAAKCQLETLARGEAGYVTLTDPRHPGRTEGINIFDLNEVPTEAREAVAFYARSLLAGGIDHSVRIGEGVRVDLWPDEHDPLGVMRGHAHMGKDGAPVDIYAPASGFLGYYSWYPDHLVQCHESGITFPSWVKPQGSAGEITLSKGIKRAVARKEDVRDALKSLLRMKPLTYSDAEMEEMNLQGHSGHASIPDWARSLGENITIQTATPMPPAVAKGFTEPELDLLGHWLRSAETKDESRASAAAASSAPNVARRAAAIVLVRARARTAHKMRNYYGTGGALANRFSERIRQLAARQRLAHAIRHILEGRVWHELPRGQNDILHLLSDRGNSSD